MHQQLSAHLNSSLGEPKPEWMALERHAKYGPELSCSRPFCKLKRKEHYHCNACNQVSQKQGFFLKKKNKMHL
jgi:hypothetical protein